MPETTGTFTREKLNEMYRTMLRIRRFEETAQALFIEKRVAGGIHVSVGQEACSVGACSALNIDDAVLT
ncbi:MAG: pyruvate dehydrogenase (acetyl-transferring) E1 component subunit alpha, partial [Nitrospinaceae bacterium]|nr:pyruvate dehydrogenase (acetyl-transferring) E1 component subunit alpha [Nitrospinaceae bacterium]